MNISTIIKAAPKAELHVHIEGTIEPDLLFSLATKNGVSLDYTLEQCQKRRENYSNLQDFLNDYYDGCKVLITSEDFYELAMRYFRKAIESNVLHCEVFFDPQSHLSRGVSFETVITGLTRASQEVETKISVYWIMCFLRHLTAHDATNLINQAEPFVSLIKGIGLDSTEVDNPASKFEAAFEMAAAKGFCGAECLYKTAHAGEEGDPSYIISTLYYLEVKRIDHGVRALDSPWVCKFLRDSAVPLTVCPLSNKVLKVNERYLSGRKVVKELVELGIVVTINSDDPAYFGGYINENYEAALGEFEEGKVARLKEFCRNGFLASFLSVEEKQKYYKVVDEAFEKIIE